MQILSTSVLSGQTNVYLDTTIVVTFDTEVANASLNDSNFILYKMTNGAVDTQHPIVVKKLADPKQLEISPMGDLSATTSYLLLIVGDVDLNDTIVQGIKSTTNEVMDGNYVVTFTTGTSIQDNDVLTPIDHTTDGTTSGYVSPTNTTSGSVYNSVVRTNPYAGEANVRTLQSIVVEFASAIQSTDIQLAINVERATWPFETLPELYQPSGFVIGAKTLSADSRTLYIGIPSGYNSLPENTLYQCVIGADAITGLGAAYSWLFFSKFHPAYAHPRQVRARTGTQFTDVPDALIWFLIHENSRYIDTELGVHYDDNAQVPENVNRWVVCKTAKDLYEQVFDAANSGVNGSIVQKTLGDLTIKYDSASSSTTKSTSVPDSIQQCVDNLWLSVIGGFGEICVKSGTTSHYPGRRRGRI